MSYHHRGLRYSYDIPDPVDMDDAGVEELIEILKSSIKDGKLRDMKSALSKLKLAINNKYPNFTASAAPFGAYVYAKENGHKKAADSLHKANVKVKYTFKDKTFPIGTFLKAFTKPQMKIIFDDYMNNSAFQWNIKGADNIYALYKEYPKETDKMIIGGKMYGFPAGDDRVDMAVAVIRNGSADALLTMFNTLYGKEFLSKFPFADAKVTKYLTALNKRPEDIQKRVRKEYFYSIAARAIKTNRLKVEWNKGKLDDETIKLFVESLVGNSGSTVMVAMEYINQLHKDDEKYKELRIAMITSNDHLLNYVTEHAPMYLPDGVVDIFVF